MKRKSAVIGFSYLFGLICASFFDITAAVIIASLLAAFLAGTLILKKHALSTSLFAIIAAIIVSTVYSVVITEPVKAHSGETLEITGTIVEKGDPDNDNASYLISTEIGGKKTLLSLYAADIYAEYGDTVRFTAKLSNFTDNTNFSESSYYYAKGVFLKATAKSAIEITDSDNGGIVGLIYDYSEYVKSVTRKYLTGDEGDLITAFFFGDKSSLTDSLKSDIKRSGVSHFASVSGMHLTLIIGTMLILLELTPLKSCHKLKFLLTAAVIIGFMIFFKLSVSVIRSGIMLLIFYAGEPLHRKTDTLNSVGFALLVILIISPNACLDTGLLLSVAGTVGIGCAAPAVSRHFSLKNKYVKAFVETLMATLFTIPLSALFFGGFSVTAVFTNLLITPFFTIVLVCMLGLTATGCVFAQPFLLVAGICTKPILMFIDLIGGFKYSYLPFNTDFGAVLITLSVAFVITAALLFRKTKYTLRAAGVSVCLFCLLYTASGYLDRDTAKIKIYSDGSDSCIMIDSGSDLAVIATNDSPKIQGTVREFLYNSFADELSLLYLFRNGDNNMGGIQSLPCQLFEIQADETEYCYTIGNSISLDGHKDYAELHVNGFTMCIAKAGTALPQSNVAVLYGYKKSLPEKTAEYTICSDRKMTDDEYINAYFTQTEILLKNNKMTVTGGKEPTIKKSIGK